MRPPNNLAGLFCSSRAALLFCLAGFPLHAAVPPGEPANPANTGGLWVGQSEPAAPCFAEAIEITAQNGPKTTLLRGTVTVSPRGGGIAKVYADWVSPAGARLREIEWTDREGVAHFERLALRGAWRFELISVLKVRHRFVPERGQTEAALAPENPEPPGGV